MRKFLNKLTCVALSLTFLMGCIATPAFAYSGGESNENATSSIFDTEEEPVTVTEQDTGPLTPEGNLTVVDDYQTTFSDGTAQQFITLVSKSGAYFYLVIDRAADGDQTVHFMNLVDEADLLALMEEDQAEAYNAEKEAALQAELEKQQAEEEAKKAAEEAAKAESEDKDFDVTGLASKFLGVIALVGLAAGGGFYFFIQKKKKEQAEKESADPDADYREGEEELELPLEEEPADELSEETKRKTYQTSDGYEDV